MLSNVSCAGANLEMRLCTFRRHHRDPLRKPGWAAPSLVCGAIGAFPLLSDSVSLPRESGGEARAVTRVNRNDGSIIAYFMPFVKCVK